MNNTPEPSTSVVISNEDDSSVGDGTKDSKVRSDKTDDNGTHSFGLF